jgi:hypothetical protein
MARAALLKGKATASMGGVAGAGGGAGNRTGCAGAKNEMRSAYNAPAGGAGASAGAAGGAGGATAREDLVKMSVTEFAKLVKEVRRQTLLFSSSLFLRAIAPHMCACVCVRAGEVHVCVRVRTCL